MGFRITSIIPDAGSLREINGKKQGYEQHGHQETPAQPGCALLDHCPSGLVQDAKPSQDGSSQKNPNRTTSKCISDEKQSTGGQPDKVK
jgi:hypothetical protein